MRLAVAERLDDGPWKCSTRAQPVQLVPDVLRPGTEGDGLCRGADDKGADPANRRRHRAGVRVPVRRGVAPLVYR